MFDDGLKWRGDICCEHLSNFLKYNRLLFYFLGVAQTSLLYWLAEKGYNILDDFNAWRSFGCLLIGRLTKLLGELNERSKVGDENCVLGWILKECRAGLK